MVRSAGCCRCRCTGPMADKEHQCSRAEAAAVGDSYWDYCESPDMLAGSLNGAVAAGWGTEASRRR